MTELNYKDCAKKLLAENNILILNHRSPDGDTLGSSAALCSALRREGKTAFIYNNTQLTEKFRPYVEAYLAPEGFKPDYIVSADIAAEHLLPLGFEGKVQLAIDHHPGNTGFADFTLLKADRASCGEIILDLIKNMGLKPTAEEATLLYIAVSTDCGCFRYANTNAHCLSAAAEILRAGADNERVNLEFFRKVSRARLMLEGLVYSGMEYYRDGRIAIATVTKEMMERCGADENDCDNLAGLAGRAEGAELAITIKETDKGSKISVRSGHEVSAADICAVFGGGGHKMAAGCTLSCEPERAREMLLAVIDEVWK